MTTTPASIHRSSNDQPPTTKLKSNNNNRNILERSFSDCWLPESFLSLPTEEGQEHAIVYLWMVIVLGYILHWAPTLVIGFFLVILVDWTITQDYFANNHDNDNELLVDDNKYSFEPCLIEEQEQEVSDN